MISYLVAGAGGIGGSIAGTLASSGKNVTLLARGEQFETIKHNGLILTADFDGCKKTTVIPEIDVCTEEEYAARRGTLGERVVFICVKSYHIPSVAPFLESIADDDTVMIPILNGMMMGEYIRGYVKGARIMDGCTYLSAMKDGPGRILMKGGRFRLVFGGDGLSPLSAVSASALEHIAEDLRSAGIDAAAADDILTHSIKKAAFVAASAGTGVYYDIKVREMQKPGRPRETVRLIAGEMEKLAAAMGIRYDTDLADDILRSLDSLSPDTESSLQRDIALGNESEFDSLICHPVRIGKKYGIEMPVLEKVSLLSLSSQKNHITSGRQE